MTPPPLAGPEVLVPTALSLIVVVLVGLWALRRTRTTRDFFIAGQGIGLWTTAMATMAAAFSGFVFLGGPGITYRLGISALAIVLPVGFTAGLLCWSVGHRLRLLAGVREVFTIPDAIACRFDSRPTTLLSIAAVITGTVGYLGAQFLALAILLEALLDSRAWLGDWSLPTTLAAGVLIVVAYSVLGGMIAGVYTDVIQGSVMLVAAVLVGARAVTVSGGWWTMIGSVAASGEFEGFFDPLATGLAPTTLGFFLVFGVGVLGQPHMLHKFYMIDDPRRLRWMPLILGGSQALCLLVWVGVGLAVPALVAQGKMTPLLLADDAAPRFLVEFAPPILTGLVVAAVIAAIMSTADSFLNIGAAALVHDLPRLLQRPPGDVRRARWATGLVALTAAALALAYGDLVALLGTFAFGTLGASLAPVFAIGLNWKRVPAAAATASIATGLVVSLGLELVKRRAPADTLAAWGVAPGMLPAAVALATSLTVLLLIAWLAGEDEGSELAADVKAVMESGE